LVFNPLHIGEYSGGGVLNFTLKKTYLNYKKWSLLKKSKECSNKSLVEQRSKRKRLINMAIRLLESFFEKKYGVSSKTGGSSVVKPVINGLFGSRVPVINNNVR
jgi:iron complex outermembrane receptor protein